MGISILEPPLSRSILLCDRIGCTESARLRRRLMLVEEEEEEGTGGTVMPSPTLTGGTVPGGAEDDVKPPT